MERDSRSRTATLANRKTDETRWMATVIEFIALGTALLFALLHTNS